MNYEQFRKIGKEKLTERERESERESCWTLKVVGDGDECDLRRLQEKTNIELHFILHRRN